MIGITGGTNTKANLDKWFSYLYLIFFINVAEKYRKLNSKFSFFLKMTGYYIIHHQNWKNIIFKICDFNTMLLIHPKFLPSITNYKKMFTF